jgi:diaminopimelate epimerase
VTIAAERWQGAGNVYLLVDAATLPRPLDPDLVRRIGAALGGDGILELSRAGASDVAMRIWNPDGSESEACGNGTRMVARWLAEQTGQGEVRIATVAGILDCAVHGERVTATLAPARLDGPQYRPTDDPFPYDHTFVSVGNPHVVIPVDDLEGFPLAEVGATLEHHPWLPERANIEIAVPVDRHRVRMRVWERGVGLTPACGTGACAVAVAAVARGTADSPVVVELPGGELEIEVGEGGAVRMTGPAERIEHVEIPAELFG